MTTMSTKVYKANLSLYSAEEVDAEYEKIKSHFLFYDSEAISNRKESKLGRILLHKALSQLGEENYTAEYFKNKKPGLKSDKELYFNISHSGDYVVLALSEAEVGCDVQQLKPYNPKVAKRHYCESEAKLIENTPDKDDMFIRLWALKESVLKFSGEGISGGLSSFDFSPFADKESFSAFGCNFYLKEVENVYFALCHKGDEIEFMTEMG